MSVVGLTTSVAAHLVSLMGDDPGSGFGPFWVFQLILLVLLIPVIAEIFRKRNAEEVLRAPRAARILLFCVLAYYGVNFYVFLFWSVDNLNSSVTWRMMSSGWMLLFTVAGVFYYVRWSETRSDPTLGPLLSQAEIEKHT